MEQVHLSCLPGFEGCELMASAWPLHVAEAHQMSPVDVITRVTVITKASMVQRACGKATPWQGGHCVKWERGGHGVRQLGCTLACPEWMCREKPNNPATPYPVKEEVADFLPGVQGRMGQTLQGVTHMGKMVGLAGVGSVPRAQSFCCCQPLMRVSELLPRGGRCPRI